MNVSSIVSGVGVGVPIRKPFRAGSLASRAVGLCKGLRFWAVGVGVLRIVALGL